MKTVRLKHNLGLWIMGQKLAVVEQRKDGLMLRGKAVFSLRESMATVTAGPVKVTDVEVVE